jgi:hypothetical protein
MTRHCQIFRSCTVPVKLDWRRSWGMVAQDIVQEEQQQKEEEKEAKEKQDKDKEKQEEQEEPTKEETGPSISTSIPKIDLKGYVRQRFEGQVEEWMDDTLTELCDMLRALKKGMLDTDMKVLKSIHKKLKKVRAWGKEGSSKKAKKRSATDNTSKGAGADDGAAPDAKRVKVVS